MFTPILRYLDLLCADCILTQHSKFPVKLPIVKELNNCINSVNANDKKLVFCTQDETLPFAELGYEERIFLHGIIATRPQNLHDFFNALIWLKYPQTKSVLNAIHYQELQKQQSSIRSKKRDLLTLFDECGVLVFANDYHLDLIRNHQWQELFVENKEAWINGAIKIETFGHAMYEKHLNPYIGMTAKALLITQGVNNTDSFLADKLFHNKLLLSKSDLCPLPVLGIPNWHKNQDADFYANKAYFR